MKGIETNPELLLTNIEKTEDGCWIWQGQTDRDGYGRTWYKGRGSLSTHRLFYEVWTGPIEPGKLIMHSCDNPPCVNPEHLIQGTHKDNMADAKNKGRKYVGITNPNSKLTEFQVRYVREMYATGVTMNKLSKTLNVSRRCIHNIVTGKSWEDLKSIKGVTEPGDSDLAVLGDELDTVSVEGTE